MRAGGKTLTRLGNPRNFLILQSLAAGTKGQRELRRDTGLPAQSTLRGHLGRLEKEGVIGKRRRDSLTGTLEYNLTEAGRELLAVAESLELWLAAAPRQAIELGSDPAKAAIKGLVEGWSAAVLTTLAERPLSLTELDKRIAAVSYPTLERCLDTMRLAEQLDVGERTPKGTPYAVTDWLRRGVAPLALGARWEHRHQPEGVNPIDQSDIDGALALSGPLFKLSGRVSGVCQLAVQIPDRKKQLRGLGFVEVQGGKISFRAVYPQVKPDAWASGTADIWFATVIDADTSGLKVGGNSDLTEAVFDGVRQALFEEGVGQLGKGAKSKTQG
jgi:DNA-binding HxlR family transcriptional regulator